MVLYTKLVYRLLNSKPSINQQVSQMLPKMWECYRKGDAQGALTWYKKNHPQLVRLENCVLDIRAGGAGFPPDGKVAESITVKSINTNKNVTQTDRFSVSFPP